MQKVVEKRGHVDKHGSVLVTCFRRKFFQHYHEWDAHNIYHYAKSYGRENPVLTDTKKRRPH